MLSPRIILHVSLVSIALLGPLAGQEKAGAKTGTAKNGNAKNDELTLEKLFPKKGLFGPGARSMEFARDGKFAAWLYRPLRERRHGSDLWLYDVDADTAERITKVSVMAPFQRATRKVKKDRIERAKKHAAKDKASAKDEETKAETEAGKSPDERLTGDWVTDDDHEQEKAPRYGGVSSFEWSPNGGELLFLSGGDVYRLRMEGRELTRLTQTQERENSVQYLPDGTGYTYLRGTAVIRVRFGRSDIEQIDPKVPAGETVAGYELSPDGNAMALLTRKGASSWRSGGRKVNIVSYRDRFATVRSVSRTVSDDPLPKQELAIYLYRLAPAMREDGVLTRVFKHELSGPRDVLRTPEWSPDGKQIVFAVFDQKSEQVRVLTAALEAEPEEKEKKDAGGDKAKDAGEAAEKKDAEKKDAARKDAAKKDEGEVRDRPARLVHRFLHHGGPTTPSMIRPQFLADSRRMVMVTEQSGFRQLHVLDPLYEQVEQLTRGRFEVYPIDLSKDRTKIWVTATKESPSRAEVYSVELADGSMRRISVLAGNYSGVAVSPDGEVVLGTFSTFGLPAELHVMRPATGQQRALTDSHEESTKKLVKVKPQPFTYQNRHGHEIHGHMFKPADWTEKDRRPLLIYVYGGPLGTRKTVTDGSYSSASYLFARYMTEKHGWVACSIDPRGQSGYGGLFEKANFEQVGKPQVEDLVDGAKFFVEKHGVDKKRIAMHGWSFGGFQTQMCLYTEPDVFAAGIAGAGPTEWENYNIWYSQGTIGKTKAGSPDLKKFSLLPLAKNLKGRLLLVHGMEDSNVLYQDTVRVYRELLKAGKEALVDLFLDPTGGHGLGGDVKSVNRYRKYEDFLLLHVGKGVAAKPKPKPKVY